MSELFTADAETAAEFQQMMQDPAARQAFVEAKAHAAKTGAKVRYSHVLRAVSETPWAIRPSMLAVIVDMLAFRIAGGRFSAEEIQERVMAGRVERPHDAAPAVETVAVLPIDGVIVPKASAMSDVSGGTSLEDFRGQFRSALSDEAVKAIVLDINSPGGMVPGVPEMAAEIRASRNVKPIVAVANHEAASAAYWLGAQASKFFVTKSGRVGSVGVYTTHENRAGEAAAKGVDRTIVSAGQYKTEGNPYEPLSDEGLAHMQSQVDEYYGMFVADIAKGRGVGLNEVKEGFGQGREMLARAAYDEGMVDGVATLESVIKSLLASPRGKHTSEAAMSTTAEAEEFVVSFDIDPEAWEATEESLAAAETKPDEADDSWMLVEDFEAAEDGASWDGNKAMGQCKSASDYRSICAGVRNVGEPDERQHWALPHHYLGQGPNAAGVRNALARIGQTQGLTNREAAQAHLERHQGSAKQAATGTDEPVLADEPSIEPEDEQRSGWEAILDRTDQSV